LEKVGAGASEAMGIADTEARADVVIIIVEIKIINN